MMDDTKLIARPIKKKLAPDYVIEQIKESLIEKKLKPGDKLPSETELIEIYGVSRGSVRQAMKSLEMLGVITIRPGDGTYVNSCITSNNLNPLAFSMLLLSPTSIEFSNARLMLELNIMKLVLENKNELESIMPKLEDNIKIQDQLIKSGASIERMVENDKHFHMMLSGVCNNKIMQSIYDFVIDGFSSLMLYTTKMQNRNNIVCENTVDHHRLILNSLKSGEYKNVENAVKQSMDGWGRLIKETES